MTASFFILIPLEQLIAGKIGDAHSGFLRSRAMKNQFRRCMTVGCPVHLVLHLCEKPWVNSDLES
jgi:hypothetical protein